MKLSYRKTPEIKNSGPFWTKDEFRDNRKVVDGILTGDISVDDSDNGLMKFLQEFAFQELLQIKPVSKELNTGHLKSPGTIVEWMRTFHALGIHGHNKKRVEEYDKNYVEWLGKKLLLPHEQYEKMSRQEIDTLVKPYLLQASRTMLDFHDRLHLSDEMKSAYYESIHNFETVYDLLQKFYDLLKELKIKNKGKVPAQSPLDIPNLQMGMYEIIRILVMLKNILLWHQTPSAHTLQDDSNFLIRKIAFLSGKAIGSDSEIQGVDNPLYRVTTSRHIYWKKNGNGTYNTREDKKYNQGTNGSIRLEGLTLKGKLREGNNSEDDIQLLHINYRSNKDAARGTLKRERKGLISFDEVHDKKGFQLVVAHESDKVRLLRLLETELSTGNSGWLESPEVTKNEHTDPTYRCVKGILSIPYKVKDTRAKIKDSTRAAPRRVRDKVRDATKGILERPPYNIAVEIQIFTLDEYIKAEYDKTSPANHSRYERRQEQNLIPILYPKSIYGRDLLLDALGSLIKERANELLKKVT